MAVGFQIEYDRGALVINLEDGSEINIHAEVDFGLNISYEVTTNNGHRTNPKSRTYPAREYEVTVVPDRVNVPRLVLRVSAGDESDALSVAKWRIENVDSYLRRLINDKYVKGVSYIIRGARFTDDSR